MNTRISHVFPFILFFFWAGFGFSFCGIFSVGYSRLDVCVCVCVCLFVQSVLYFLDTFNFP
ncbi:hypothetical protein FN846DRAFT_928460 [Sphaerosporella brunnea]|uniref:Uncharacterized protein n=1 Tax=Sphaerosporella brunnea TaxID=1250544 RepID=A0A5J5F8W6_9PEZI|nr:hypothetical protein FN846DRAFT_928460 [Sphaerosporella brunnea]